MAGMIERGNVMDPELAIFLLSELDGMIQSDIMLYAPEEIVSYTDQEQELLLRKPHDGIYLTFLTAMIRQTQGEYEGYNNAMESFNEKLETFREWYVAHYDPAETASREYMGAAPGGAGYGFAYLTAYGLAVKHGYAGSEEEWLASLEGQPGAPGEAARMRFDAERGVIRWGVGEQWYDLFTIEELKDPVVEAMMAEVRTLAEQASRDKEVANQAANTAAGHATAAGGHAKTAAKAAEDALTLAGRAYASEQAAVTAAGDAQVQAETAEGYAMRAETAAKRAEEAVAGGGSGGNQTQEVTVSVAVGADPVTLDGAAPEQVVNLAWQVQNARTVPAFPNYFVAKSGIAYPRELKAGYNQFWSSTAGHGNADAFDASHKYFVAIRYEMDGDSSAKFDGGSIYQTPTGTSTLTGSGWVYGTKKHTTVGSSAWNINDLSGTGRVTAAYCIDVTAMQEAGTITTDTTAELVEVFGGLSLIPGQDYPGGTIGDGTATLSIARGGETITVDNTVSTATVKGGDILSVEGGSVTFMLTILKPVSSSGGADWAGITWAVVGDSLTDSAINAPTKYHKLIAERTGITVVEMGKGGTGYWATNDIGTAFYQRMANVPSDARVITIFGSVNDWKIKNNNVEIGTASDTIEDGTLAGYINECIDVAIAKAPYAQIALITPMDYHGLPDDTLEAIANIIVAIAKHRKIKCLDLYHESGFRVDDPVFAQAFCTDYSADADTYGHPSNLAHEKIIAPEFMELLRRMIF